MLKQELCPNLSAYRVGDRAADAHAVYYCHSTHQSHLINNTRSLRCLQMKSSTVWR